MKNAVSVALIFLTIWRGISGDLEYKGNFYTCGAPRCKDGDCKLRPGCSGHNWLTTPSCRHCENGYFGLDCKAYSPRCIIWRKAKKENGFCLLVCEESTGLYWLLISKLRCYYHCVASDICVDRYSQPICEAPCEQCYSAKGEKRIGCHEGMCAVQGDKPPRICSLGYGIARVEHMEMLGTEFYKCAKCSGANCNTGITCKHDNFMECSCDNSDYMNDAAPSYCRRCPVDKWGPNCENACFCASQAVCDIDTGECKCKDGGKTCRKCPNGRIGLRCEEGCKVHCMDSPLVKCDTDFCYALRRDEKVCPYGYGAYNVKAIEVDGVKHQGYNCTRCFAEQERDFMCGSTDATPMCSDSDYMKCSCKLIVYKANLIPAGCRECNDPKKWGRDCENDCLCDDNAVCDYVTGKCLCPKTADGQKSKCRRCPYLRSGENCEEKCTGKCNDDQLVECKADRCIALVPHIRPCAFGYGAISPYKNSEGAQCTRCFGLPDIDYFTTTLPPISGDDETPDDDDEEEDEEGEDEDESIEAATSSAPSLHCGSHEVTCSNANFTSCSCSPFDYPMNAVPVGCRRCPKGKYGKYCDEDCLCVPSAICNDQDGTCYCNDNKDCNLKPCIRDYYPKTQTITDDEFKRVLHTCWPIDSKQMRNNIRVLVSHYDSFHMFMPAIYAAPGLAMTLAVLGICVELLLERNRIAFVYWQQMNDLSAEKILH